MELWGTIDRAFDSHAQGITCPAWLLPKLTPMAGWRPYIIATGVVSDGVNPRHHAKPRTIEFALKHGATHVVVGTEVIGARDPIASLRSLCERYTAAKGIIKPGTFVDKTV